MPDPVNWWCDGGSGVCEIGDPILCPNHDEGPGFQLLPFGSDLHRGAETSDPTYPLRGDAPEVGRVEGTGIDALMDDREVWEHRTHRLMFQAFRSTHDLWPCTTHGQSEDNRAPCFGVDPARDIENCRALHPDSCHRPGDGDCYHINCGLAVHGGDGSDMRCSPVGNFPAGLCRKGKTDAVYSGHPLRNRHMVGGQLIAYCQPFLNNFCWGKNRDTDANQDEYTNSAWQAWNHAILDWSGRPKFKNVSGNQDVDLRNRAMGVLRRNAELFCVDQIHRTTVGAGREDCPHTAKPYSHSDLDVWDAKYNAQDREVPRDRLIPAKGIEGARLRYRDVPVEIAIVVVAVTVTMSLQLLELDGLQDIRDQTLHDDGPHIYPHITMKIEMQLRPRVTIAPEHGVTVVEDVYATNGPVFDPPDRLHYPDAWRPPQSLEWWGVVGPYSQPQVERRTATGTRERKCETLRQSLAGQVIGGMVTDWSPGFGRPDSRDPGGEASGQHREVYNGSIGIVRIGAAP